MINTKELLRRTGIMSQKTLTRWSQHGLIPAPMLGTHPSGRGRLGYYPDEILERCQKIIEFKKEGFSLRHIATFISDALPDQSFSATTENESGGIAVGDIVDIDFPSMIDGLRSVEVLHMPVDVGDSWKLKGRDGKHYEVILFCKMTKVISAAISKALLAS